MAARRGQAFEDFAVRTPPGPKAGEPEAVAPIVTADDLIDEHAPWLPGDPEKKAVFFQMFRYWHGQVRPELAAEARPVLLFLVTALPMMVEARNALQAIGAWDPTGGRLVKVRAAHPSWRKYNEILPAAEKAASELEVFRHLSVRTALDEMTAYVLKEERRLRAGAR